MRFILYIFLLLPFAANAQFISTAGGGPGTQGTGAVIPAPVADYYVSTSGDDSNDGLTILTPWATLNHADSFALAGSVIALEKGNIWSSAIAVNLDSSGTAGNPTIWDGGLWGTGANAIIRSSGDRTAPNSAVVNIVDCEYVTLQNITIDGNNTKCHVLVIGGGSDNVFSAGAVQNNENNIIIQDCKLLDAGDETNYYINTLIQTWHNDISDITFLRDSFDGASDHVVSFYPGRTNNGSDGAFTISDVYFGYNVMTNWGRRDANTADGLQLNNDIDTMIVEYNTFTTGASGHRDAIRIASNEPTATSFPKNITIRYNTFDLTEHNAVVVQEGRAKTVLAHHNLIENSSVAQYDGGITVSLDGTGYASAVLEFYFNTMYLEGCVGFRNDSQTDDVAIFKNNIVWSNSTDAGLGRPCLRKSGTQTFVHNNNIYHREINDGDELAVHDYVTYYTTEGQVQGWEATAEITDPTFTVNGSNFHLQTGSPAIDAGVAIIGITEDIEGVTLTDPPNIGAYETVEDP